MTQIGLPRESIKLRAFINFYAGKSAEETPVAEGGGICHHSAMWTRFREEINGRQGFDGAVSPRLLGAAWHLSLLLRTTAASTRQ